MLKILIVATTTTFASIAGEIAGTGMEVEIYSIASPKQDIHFIEPTPKDVLKVKKAGVFIHGGLDLEAWRGPLLDAAGRREFLPGGERQIDVSKGIELLEVPEKISRSQGDIHIYGNPHYWLDPENGRKIAENIAEGLSRFYPESSGIFQQNLDSFKERLAEKKTEWSSRMSPFYGRQIVTYHNDWPYFAAHFGLNVAGFLEPQPGIPPTAKHLAELSRMMKEQGIRVIVKEPFQESRTPQKLAQETAAKVLTLYPQVGGSGGIPDYFSWMEFNVSRLAEVLETEERPGQ